MTSRRRSDHAALQRRSWDANAEAWTHAVRSRQIESRRVATDAAILQAILSRSPSRVLDLGCGEGWLCRALAERGIEAVGIDASAPLIEAARMQGGGTFVVRSFEEVATFPAQLGAFEVVVCNFSLLEEDLVTLLRGVVRLLMPSGSIFIQTVHPWAAGGDQPYESGWRSEDFESIAAGFQKPMPWFFRTLGDWVAQLAEAGMRLERLSEPLHPQTRQPLSLLMRCAPEM